MFDPRVTVLAEELVQLARRITAGIGPECPGAVADELFSKLALVAEQVDLGLCAAAERVDRSLVWQVDGSASTNAHLCNATGHSRGWVSARLSTGRALAESLPVTRQVWADGKIGLDQARIIRSAVEHLNDELTSEIERHLAELAGAVPIAGLKQVAEHVRQAAAPEDSQERDRQRFHQQYVDLAETFGGFRLTGWLNTEHGALLRTALESFTPKPDQACDKASIEQPPATPKLRRALGLIELARQAVTHQGCGKNSPARPTVVLTLPYEDFKARFGAADVENGGVVAATAVRRLACEANVIALQLNADGEAVELGRKRRTVTPAQRVLLNYRDKGCTFTGCDRPPAWSDAHHLIEWADGGLSNLDNYTLLCHRHHHLMHEGGWTHSGKPGIDLRFHPPDIRRRC